MHYTLFGALKLKIICIMHLYKYTNLKCTMNTSIRYYAYLRASTKEQNARRAKSELQNFVDEKGFSIAAWFIENESGTKLDRPELFKLMDIAVEGDVILIEQVDRISRLTSPDWIKLKTIISEKGLKIVSLDLPTSHQFIKASDDFTDRMLNALNSMMLDMLAAIARKEYDDRRRRQAEGVKKAKEAGKYRGRPVDIELHTKIKGLLLDGKSWSYIEKLLGCSRHTISKVSKQIKQKPN